MVAAQTFLFCLLLMILHETGHVISARIMNIPIQKIGASLQPYPHFYVQISWPHSQLQKYIYLFSGMCITSILFCIAYFNNFWNSNSFLYALIIQLVLEANPFHSDIIIAIVTNRESFRKAGYKAFEAVYKKELEKYHYSLTWYIHFCIWLTFILLLLKLI